MAGIVVVGAGVAGLVCAWRLQRAGHDVEVLEQSPYVGGRLRAETHGDVRVPVGAGFVTDGQRNVLSVAAALGLDDKIVELEPNGAGVPGAILRRGRFEACSPNAGWSSLRSQLLPVSSKLRLGRLAGEVLRRRERLDPVHPERAARLEEAEDMPRFAARVAGTAARDRLLSPVMSSLLGCEPEELSAAFFLLTLKSLSQGASPISFEGGLDALVTALAQPLAVRTECEVFSVETEHSGARVRYRGAGRERSFLAEAVVMAVPGPVVLDLCHQLTPEEQSFFGAVAYAPAITVNIPVDSVPMALPFATAFSADEGFGLRSIFRSGRLLTVSLDDLSARRFAQSKDEEITGWTLDAIARTPLGQVSMASGTRGVGIVHRWQYARPIFPRGALARLEQFGVRIVRSPRLTFAGDYLVGPTVEGALTSGMQAASRVIRSLEDTGLAGIRSRICHDA